MTPDDMARARRVLMKRDLVLAPIIKKYGACGIKTGQRKRHLLRPGGSDRVAAIVDARGRHDLRQASRADAGRRPAYTRSPRCRSLMTLCAVSASAVRSSATCGI